MTLQETDSVCGFLLMICPLVAAGTGEPRQRGNREAIRVLLATCNGAVVARTKALNHLHALVVTAPDRSELDSSARANSPHAGAASSGLGSTLEGTAVVDASLFDALPARHARCRTLWACGWL